MDNQIYKISEAEANRIVERIRRTVEEAGAGGKGGVCLDSRHVRH